MSAGTMLPVALIVLASVLGAAGQFLFQEGARRWDGGALGFVTNPFILGAIGAYLAVLVMFTVAFRAGGTVRVLYPIYATTFIWAAIVAWIGLDETIRPVNLLGMLLLLGGVFLMSG